MPRGRRAGESPRYWTQEEEATLARMVEQKTSLTAMAWKLNRTDSSIAQKIRQLKLHYVFKYDRVEGAYTRSGMPRSRESLALNVTQEFASRLTEFCHDRGATRAYVVESVITAFMNQVESGAGE